MKQFFTEYGFTIVSTVVVILLVVMCTPIGDVVRSHITTVVDNFGQKTQARLNNIDDEETTIEDEETPNSGDSGEKKDEDSKEEETHTHSFTTVVSKVEATCDKAGSVTYKCSCGETKTETIAKLSPNSATCKKQKEEAEKEAAAKAEEEKVNQDITNAKAIGNALKSAKENDKIKLSGTYILIVQKNQVNGSGSNNIKIYSNQSIFNWSGWTSNPGYSDVWKAIGLSTSTYRVQQNSTGLDWYAIAIDKNGNISYYKGVGNPPSNVDDYTTSWNI